MKFRTLVKTLASLVVIGVLAFACMLAWHVAVEPLGPPFEKLIPAEAGLGPIQEGPEAELVIEEVAIPEVDPGEPVLQKVKEELALGHVQEARRMLELLTSRYPQAESAAAGRRILSEMNLDDRLSLRSMVGKTVYRVKPGDSYLGIAVREKTTLENMLHLNAMRQVRGLRPGDELIVMPLNAKVVIDSKRRTLALWEERFVCEFPLHSLPDSLPAPGSKTVIDSKAAYVEGKRVLPESDHYAAAAKSLILKQPALRIEGQTVGGEGSGGALVLSRNDMEELNLLVRAGNEVEFR